MTPFFVFGFVSANLLSDFNQSKQRGVESEQFPFESGPDEETRRCETTVSVRSLRTREFKKPVPACCACSRTSARVPSRLDAGLEKVQTTPSLFNFSSLTLAPVALRPLRSIKNPRINICHSCEATRNAVSNNKEQSGGGGGDKEWNKNPLSDKWSL